MFYFNVMYSKHINVILVIAIEVLLNNVCCKSDDKSSLTFVIDKTFSMGTVIKAVQSGASAIFDTVANSDDSPIENFVLVTFGDPDVSNASITKNREEFKTCLNTITLESGDDCPELSMSGIYTALEASLPSSYVYVFTDASAKDYERVEDVKKLSQEKGSQVVFILTGKCNKSNATVNDVYLKLAEATSGQVFHLLKQDINQILKYVRNSIESRRVLLYAKKYPPGEHTFPYEADSRTKSTTIAISGSYPEATVLGPDGETIDMDVIVSFSEILILKGNETMPGNHNVTFSSESTSYIVVSAHSDVRFSHGFSAVLPSSLNDTVYLPIQGFKNYLSIKLSGHKLLLTAVKFLSPNYHTLAEIPLKIIDKEQQLYVTDPIDPPYSTFRIAVKAIDLTTNTTITRFGIMLLEPERYINTNPTVNIEGDVKITIDYDKPLKLKCLVKAYPKPNIIWKDNNEEIILPATVSTPNPPYDYISILELKHVNKNATYECNAVNKLGSDSEIVQVEVIPKPYLTILEGPKSNELDFNTDANLNCKVDAYPPAKITWHFYPRRRSKISIKPDLKLSLDNSTLTIKNIQPSARGLYVCEAENVAKKVIRRAYVSIAAKRPEINKNISDVHVREGGSTSLTCNLLEGKPKPEMRWYRKHSPSAKYIEIDEGRNQTNISLRNVNRHDTGIYKCTAGNFMGMDVHIMDIDVECPPTVKDDVKSIVVKKGDQLYVKCIVEGIPKPEVIWLKDGSVLGSEFQIYSDNSFKLKEAEHHHTGEYTCIATNKLGTARRMIQVVVYTLHISAPESKHSVIRNKKLNIKCEAEGVPELTYKWIFYSFDKSVPPKTLSTKKSKLMFKKIKKSDRGNYTCVASNAGGSLNVTHEVDVLFPPTIHSDLKKKYVAVIGDRHLKIHCRANGNPEPGEIVWFKNGASLAEGDKYLMDDHWLVIKNVEKSDASESYQCEVRNTVGRDIGYFVVKIEDSPSIKELSTKTVTIEEGERSPIECSVPHRKVDKIVWYKDGKILQEGELELNDAMTSDAGLYTCRVSYADTSTAKSANTKVLVKSKLRFVTEEKVKMELEFGESGFLNCKVLDETDLIVNWWHNDKKLTFSEMLFNFNMGSENVGEYKCKVTDKLGNTVTRTFDLSIKGCVLKIDTDSKNEPLMITPSGKWPTHRIIDGFTIIPNKELIIFSCPKLFTNYNQTEIKAQCEGGSRFKVAGAIYNYADIECKEKVKARVRRTRKECFGKDTEGIDMVFDVGHKKIKAYEICVDNHGFPTYAKHTLRSLAETIPKDTSVTDSTKLDDLYVCRYQKNTFSRKLRRNIVKDNCCFGRRQLVNPKDVLPGPAQRATFSRLNMVPQWSSCHTENWNELEKKVRNLSKSINNDLIVYTGTARHLSLPDRFGRKKPLALGLKTNQPIAEYLWKVIQYPAGGSSLAVIQLNTPEISRTDIDSRVVCRDICKDLPWMKGSNWRSIERGYTYCCELKDFVNIFSYSGVFQPDLYNVLNTTIV